MHRLGNRVRAGSVLGDGSRELLEKERIPFASAQNRVRGLCIDALLRRDRPYQLRAVGGAER